MCACVVVFVVESGGYVGGGVEGLVPRVLSFDVYLLPLIFEGGLLLRQVKSLLELPAELADAHVPLGDG